MKKISIVFNINKIKTYQKNPFFISVPGSKYITNRAIITGALAKGTSILNNAPVNDDINIALDALRLFGVNITQEKQEDKQKIKIIGVDGCPKESLKAIYTGASGTFSRFIISFASLVNGKTQISGTKKMNTRPMKDIILALKSLGANINHQDFLMPLTIKGPVTKNKVEISGAISSQYISSLLLSMGAKKQEFTLSIREYKTSTNYVLMTIQVMNDFGVTPFYKETNSSFIISKTNGYQARSYDIVPDPSSLSYFITIAALLPTDLAQKLTFPNLIDNSYHQGEVKITEILEQMGCHIIKNKKNNTVQVIPPLKGLNSINIDMNNMPDIVQNIILVSVFAKGTTRITNIQNLRYKECDRINDTAKELKKIGVSVKTASDSLEIEGLGDIHNTQIKPPEINTYEDHRMAMVFALAAIRINSGVIIKDPDCVNKSFPLYWDYLKKLGFEINNL